VERNTPQLIRDGTRELLRELVAANDLDTDQIISAVFTVTHDLQSEFPARAAREMGWTDVPLLCALEIDVPGALPLCIRVLLHVSSSRTRADIRHVYLHQAVSLRSHQPQA
jgi:chorismate mutase